MGTDNKDAGDEADRQLQPDVRSTAIVPASHKEASALARVMGGDLPPNRGLFWCMNCGFIEDETKRESGGVSKYPKGLTIEFEPDEMAAMGGDPYAYQGPCPVCNMMMLVNMELMGGDGFSIRGRAAENRKRDVGEAADVFLDKVQERAGAVIASALTGAGGQPAAEKPAGDAAPGRENLPDVNEVDLSNLKR